MALGELWRYRCVWSGWSGAPGYSSFYTLADDQPQAHADAVRAFLDQAFRVAAAPEYLPQVVKITFDATIDRVDANTNKLIGTSAVNAPAVIQGTGSNLYSAASGACVTWKTSDHHDGRRVVGRTFLVPLNGLAYENDGTLGSGFLTQVRAATAAYIANANTQPQVMSRVTATHPGGAHPIIAGDVRDKAAVLRSRRD